MEEHFTGRSLSLEDAIGIADQIVVGRLTETGSADPGAPGQAYYDHAAAEIVQWLHGEPRREKRPTSISFAYTVQTLPPAAKEAAPAVGQMYIFFLSERSGIIRAVKILPAGEEHVAKVEQALRRP
jgi:hypothetical protein